MRGGKHKDKIEKLLNNRIDKLFEQRDPSSKIASLFITAGYPDLQSTADLIIGMAENGADMIELGMPFSDPLADGPTIQYSSAVAIENGITMNRIFDTVQKVRQKSQVPIILMGYLNPILRYGIKSFCREAQLSGADGLIVPDLPPEESELLEKNVATHQLKLIYLVAPNTSDERMRLIDNKSEGFVYCVSVTGVTGAREGGEVAESVKHFIGRVQENITENPVLIGFGIKSHEDARQIARKADGFIVGSALINTIKNHYPRRGWKDEVFSFVRQLKYGL